MIDLDLNGLDGLGTVGLLRRGSHCKRWGRSKSGRKVCRDFVNRGGPWRSPKGKKCTSKWTGKKVNCTRQARARKAAKSRRRHGR